jgi:hypothetical protein
MNGAIPLLRPYAVMAWTGRTSTFKPPHFWVVGSIICGFSLRKLLRVTLLASRILRLLLDFMKLYTRLDERMHTH